MYEWEVSGIQAKAVLFEYFRYCCKITLEASGELRRLVYYRRNQDNANCQKTIPYYLLPIDPPNFCCNCVLQKGEHYVPRYIHNSQGTQPQSEQFISKWSSLAPARK
ncbi:hypothetical protein HZ326_13404 [Fusarium oxysporum f. sp. albedinis]|nr:hypothetical protein HZ326_13404 [Fusarium oxysporum f. sp. albedinis]